MGHWIPVVLSALGGCGGESTADDPSAEKSALKTDKGVDATAKVIAIGALNDESGPAAAIGKPYAVGKRLLAARINAGGSGLVPEGWTVRLVERDHGYNPQQSVQAYDEIKDEVLFIGTSFGTPNTLPLRPKLEIDDLVAFPASLSSEMANHPNTPPLGAPYKSEGKRAIDFIVSQAGGTDGVKAGIVYQKDDYGKDGLAGFKEAAAAQGVEVVAEQTVDPGQKDMAAVITGLQDAGATHVALMVLPSSTGPIVGTAAQLQFTPMWVGATPSWIDAFFNPEVIPSAVFANFYWAQSLPFWGEDVSGMSDFASIYEAHGKDMGTQDWYMLVSYIQGLAQIEAANRAIESGDLSRAGYKKALTSLTAYDAGGMINPIDLSKTPYQVTDQVRVLKPDFEARSWTVAMPYGAPGTMPTQDAAPAEDAEAAGDAE
ncbi:MAG: ABC transporter substrate-binding protein [Myxococcota bacterium]